MVGVHLAAGVKVLYKDSPCDFPSYMCTVPEPRKSQLCSTHLAFLLSSEASSIARQKGGSKGGTVAETVFWDLRPKNAFQPRARRKSRAFGIKEKSRPPCGDVVS